MARFSSVANSPADVRNAFWNGTGYTLLLSDADLAALDWIANRYTSAQVLYDALDPIYALDDERIIGHTIREHDAWEYRDALDAEDGDCIVPPCASGTLAETLVQLWNEIV